MGAGAVGCYYGALLAVAGAEVRLIGRKALVDAVETHGLRLEMAGETLRANVTATESPEAVAGAGLVLVAVKAGDVAAAGRAMASHLSPGAVLLTLQNGIGHAERLADALGRPAVPAVVYAAVSMIGPGHVRHSGGGKLILASAPGSERAAAQLSAAGIPVEVSDQAERVMWTKLTVNCVYNALSALSRQPYAAIVAQPGAERMMRDAVEECRAVAGAGGVTLPADLWQTVRGIAATMPAQYSSMAQDMMRGRPTEADFLNGEIVRRGEAAGLAVPVNRALWLLAKLAETGSWPHD